MKNDDKNENEEAIPSPFESEISDDVEFVAEDGEGNTLSSDAKVKKLRAELAKANKERTEYLTGWQRAQADYVNLKKEEQAKRESLATVIKEDFAESLLPALDSFTMAMSNKQAWEKVDANWRVGVEYIYTQLLKSLSDHNITQINEVGVPVDGFAHQAVEVVETDDASKDDTVAAILQMGYKIGDKIIRPARVSVWGKKK